MNRKSLAVLFAIASLACQVMLGAERATEWQGAIPRPTVANTSPRDRGVSPHYSTGTGGSEVLALDFVIEGNSCARFDSSLDLMGADTVGIAVSALQADIRKTRLITFFGVDDVPYMVASSKVLQGQSFIHPYVDAGSGVVPVLGKQMFVRVCNDATDTIRYTQLTVYVSHR